MKPNTMIVEHKHNINIENNSRGFRTRNPIYVIHIIKLNYKGGERMRNINY